MKFDRPSLRLLMLVLLSLSLNSACNTLRKVERFVPGIGDDEASAVGPTADPDLLEPDLENNAAVFKIEVQGQQRRVVIQLYPDAAPKTVANFQQNVRSGYYKGMAIHRAIPNYLVQMGDPQSRVAESRAAWGTGGMETSLPAEIKLAHRLGAVGMARLGDASNPSRRSSGSQFYVVLGDMKKSDGQYTVFGQVIQGYETLQTISAFPADENDNPYQRLEIKAAHLDQARDFAPEEIDTIQRKTRRRTIQEIPTEPEGLLKRTWRRIW